MTAPLTDEITIECIALRLGCRAELIRKAAQMPDYDPALLAARRANFIASIQAHEADGVGLWMQDADGSDTDMSSQLQDAGFGTGGIL